jgi:anti-sigma regulatory factor (Ser/Thr protein kinase)
MISVPVRDQSQVAEVRREAVQIAERQGFGSGDAGRVALVATELATNVLKHASEGEVLTGTFDDMDGIGVELIALDKGSGMSNVAACLQDGYSSAGTAGKGLGAVVRQSSIVDIASWAGVGTAVLARIMPGKTGANPSPPRADWGAVAVPMSGQSVCGDSWSVANTAAGRTLMVVDGLGHGPDAAEAAVEAVRIFNRFNGHQVTTLLDYIHGGLRSTRGAAISIARYDAAARKIVYAGIGNIAGILAANGMVRRMVSMAGTAGFNARKIQSFDYPFDSGLVILHSDGLQSQWTLDRYPNLASFHPTLIAAILYRDFNRGRDDATVLVCKW